MRVISFVSQKGGSGKTTLCFSLGVAAREAGRKVFMLDLDRQASLRDWYADREARHQHGRRPGPRVPVWEQLPQS